MIGRRNGYDVDVLPVKNASIVLVDVNLALAIVLVPIAYFIMKRIDRAVGAAGMD